MSHKCEKCDGQEEYYIQIEVLDELILRKCEECNKNQDEDE